MSLNFEEFSFIGFLLLLLINFILFLCLNYLALKYHFLIDKKYSSKHKIFIGKELIPYTGSIIFIINYYILYFGNSTLNNLIIFLIFLLGLASDAQKINSTLIRFALQIILIVSFLYLNKIIIPYIYINSVDNLINNNFYFGIIFTAFCLLILLNGSNFIDGANLICSGYYISILITIFYLLKIYDFYLPDFKEVYFLSFLLVFGLFNSLNKTYLGDGGVYLISFSVGIFLIKFFAYNDFSPYFVALLLWYPAFENLFTILRRRIFSLSNLDRPDNDHLHHYLFQYINNKSKIDFIKKNGAGIIIVIYNFILFNIAKYFVFKTGYIVTLIFISIIIYIFTYIYLKKINIK